MTTTTIQRKTTIRSMKRSLGLKAAVGLAAIALVASARPASALTYVNLLDNPAPSVNLSGRLPVYRPPTPTNTANGQVLPEPLPEPGGDPVSVSYGNGPITYSPPQAIDGSAAQAAAQAQLAAQALAQFNQWAAQVLQARQNADAEMRQSVGAYDQFIYQQWVAREQARSGYQSTGQNSYAQAYWTAQATIERLQTARWNYIAAFFKGNSDAYNTLYAHDPNQQQNLSWYQQKIAADQSLQNTILAQVQADFGLKAAKYQGLPQSR